MTLRLGTNNPNRFRACGLRIGTRKASMVRFAIRGPKYEQFMTRQIIYLMAIVILGVSLVACEPKKICEINADRGRYMNKGVAVIGQMRRPIGGFGQVI